MRKVISSIIIVFFMNIFPLLFKPELLLHYKSIIILITALAIFLTQPAFSFNETVDNKTTDKFSIIIILFTSILCVGSSLAEWAYFNDKNSNLILSILGLLFIIGGLAIRIFSIITLGKYFTATARATERHVLIKSGPYSLVRHPSYLGAIMVMIGVPLLLNNTITLFTTIILLWIAYTTRINTEEKLLNAVFGNDYRQYSMRVKKLIPFIW